MASQPMPLFYHGLEPLSSELHGNYRVRRQDRAPFLANQHAVPITVDEFPLAQRHMPIVFTVGDANDEWGVQIAEGKNFMTTAWWISVFPGAAIIVTGLGFSLLGDGLAALLRVRR